MEKWFLVYCKANQDEKAERNLKSGGYEVFRPTIMAKKRKLKQKTRDICESLFPRYLFIRVDPHVKSIAPVVSTYGVSNLVRFGQEFANVSNDLISKIKDTAEKQQKIRTNQETLRKGDGVVVSGEGFEDINAIYCNPCGKERAMILMNILGQQSKVVVAMDRVRKVQEV